ncbi:MAG TPA: tetratricopeptide repeat protein [Steroidobacteraceae bacterium]|nr:tetratricopeptide repeat protein [Steroidobacteraceae bacterium]
MRSARAIRQLSCALAVFATLVALAGCGNSHSRYESHMARARQYLAAGNLDKANIEFRNALQIEPHNADALYFNGRVAERRGAIHEAVDFYQAAVDAHPKDDRALASLAKVFILAGATQRALEVISPGLLEHPDSPDLLAARAAARHELNDDPDARQDAERAVRLAPGNENAIAVLAALELRANNRERAVSLLHDAVAKAPDSVDLRRILASVYLSTDQPDKAEDQMRRIIALEPTEFAPRLQLARHFVGVRKLDEAQRVLEEAVRDLPRKDEAKLTLVDFITTQRSRQQGEKVLQDFLAREPDNEDLRLGLGTLLNRTGATQEAIAIYQEIIRREGTRPKGLAARDRIAAIYIAQGHENDARRLIDAVLEQSAHDDDALIMRANIALTHNDPTNAIVDLRAVLSNQPKSVVLQRLLARAYLAKTNPALAEGALRAAMEAAPGDASVRIELAQFLTQTDRASQAVTLLEETVHNTPDAWEAREALIRAYIANKDLSAASAEAENLKRLRPSSTEGYYLAGLIAHDEGRPDDSEKNLERALELQPTSLDILTSLTRFSLDRGRDAAAIARLRRAVERDPDNVQLLDLLGVTYLEVKNLSLATEVLTRARMLDPQSWVAYRDLARVRLAADDATGAVEEYKAARKLAPTQPGVATELAGLYEKQGRVDEAISCYESLQQSDPAAKQLAANNIAMLLASYKTDKASLDRARALTADFDRSDNASLLDTLGWVRFKRREYRDAVVALERAADRSPDSKVIRYHLGMAQLKLGEPEHARVNLESALSGSGSFTGSEEARSALASIKTPRPG